MVIVIICDNDSIYVHRISGYVFTAAFSTHSHILHSHISFHRKLTAEKRKEIEDLYESTRIQDEEYEYDTIGLLKDVNSAVEIVVCDAMLDMIDLQYDYYKKCLTIIEDKKERIRLSKERVAERKALLVKERDERAAKTPAHLRMLQQQHAMFGVPLAVVMSRDDETGEIPNLIRRMIDWVDAYGLKVIFYEMEIAFIF